MYSFLRTPRWIAALFFTLAVVVVFVLLGNWQLERHAEVIIENEVGEARRSAEPLSLGTILEAVGSDLGSLEFRRATATGEYEPRSEIFVRNEVDDGRAGFHVVTPLRTDSGTFLVNRGWVPLSTEGPPATEAPPPEGEVEVEVLLRPSETRPRFGRIEPEGPLDVVNRVDLDRLAEQYEDLVPVWGQVIEDDGRLPIALDVPAFDDDGPHLEYALQWFAFAVIAAGGAAFLIRSHAHRGAKT